MQKHFICGSCDFQTVQPDKIQSHYMGKHGLSYADANIMRDKVVGELMTGQEFFDNFYGLVKEVKKDFKRLGPGAEIHINNKGYLTLARRAAGLV